jgi:glycosyltransferase involved in cell wall biosynthesis
MKILFIAPLPPPVTGHSLVSKVLYDDLSLDQEVIEVNLSKNSLSDGEATFERILEVLKILKKVIVNRRKADIVYLTISESFAGNMKDLLIYLICFSKLSSTYIHLHGGSIKRLLWDSRKNLYRMNRLLIRKMAGAIVSGNSHLEIFHTILPEKSIHIVPNFAQDNMFSSLEEIELKFEQVFPLRILYMSGFIPKKGYNELVDAFCQLPEELKLKVRIDMAGMFETEALEKEYLGKIRNIDQIVYHGVVNEDRKKELFSNAHIFCLPTTFFEGQPISILEAYASGCVVITTGQKGILDIFADEVNGFMIDGNLSSSIKSVISRIFQDQKILLPIALHNWNYADRNFRMSSFNDSIREILHLA